MDDNNDQTIIDVILKSSPYIILLSGLPESHIIDILENVSKSFPHSLTFDYMHITDDFTAMNTRINDVLKKNKLIFIISKSFPQAKIDFSYNLHINLSINSKILDNPELLNSYHESLNENVINKYYNIKPDTDIESLCDKIFDYIIDNMERYVYKDKYNLYSHKFYTK